MKTILAFASSALVLLFAGFLHAGPTFTLLGQFGTSPDGAIPNAIVQAPDGNFYGTTSKGGVHGLGTVFKLSPTGVLTTIYSFVGGNSGTAPMGMLAVGNDGNLYGTTPQGGTSQAGTFFQITPAGVFTTLHSFNGTSEGAASNIVVKGTDGNFYMASAYAGLNGNQQGAFLKLTTSGTVTVVHQFTNSTDGGAVSPNIVQGSDGAFYGTTEIGGANNFGTLYRVTTAGAFSVLTNLTTYSDSPQLDTLGTDGLIYGINGEQDLLFKMTNAGVRTTTYTFTRQNDGAYASSYIQGNDGNFYGTTVRYGANGYGTFFRLTPTGTFTTLYAFQASAGNGYDSLLQAANGRFYATSLGGGTGQAGAVLQLTSAGAATSVYSFVLGPINPIAALLQGADGNFYGTTQQGGKTNDGTFFQVTPAGKLTIMANFAFDSSGSNPSSPLIQDPTSHLFYGTTVEGGQRAFDNEGGTLFSAMVSGSTATLSALVDYYSFIGAYPAGLSLPIAENTTFHYSAIAATGAAIGAAEKIKATAPQPTVYGVAGRGGTYDGGTFYAVSARGGATPLYSFGSSTANGYGPESVLIQDSAGNLYGTCGYGGSSRMGTIFKITPVVGTTGSTITTIHTFTGPDGASPSMGNLLLAKNGLIYGTTPTGGANGYGVIFSISTSGTYAVVHSFNPGSGGTGSDGANPEAGLIQATDGNFYGTTSAGGDHSRGTIFSLTPSGILTNIYSFTGQGDGQNPLAALVQGKDGALYGVTSSNYYGTTPGSAGTVFKLSLTAPPQTRPLYFENGTSLGALSVTTAFLPNTWQGQGMVNSGWVECAVGDINGDGIPDLLFQNGTVLGALTLDSSGNSVSWITIGSLNAGWQLHGAGFITGDGQLDLVCQNGTNLAFLEVSTAGGPLTWNVIGAMGAGWKLHTVADLNGDGHPDLLFQNGTSLGALQVGTNGVPTTFTGLGTVNAGWILSDAVDVNLDGQPDLIFEQGSVVAALEVTTAFVPTTWHTIGDVGAGWILPGDY